jgi:hypothetical protein
MVDPVDRNAASPVVIAGIASEPLPAIVKRQPRHNVPDAFHNEASFSSASTASSSASAFAAA